MKTLVAYYSRTGNTRRVGQEIAKKLEADIEEIKPVRNRSTISTYIVGSFKSFLKKPEEIKATAKDARTYDLVIIGSPIWGGYMTGMMRSYIQQNSEKFKKVAFYVTCGGASSQKSLDDMGEAIGGKPEATLAVREKDLAKGEHIKLIKEFTDKLKE
ncbi:MAG: NAD(P)H-dependent oxidoreductase [Candidatus Altiarchaeota archaeon]